jgi:hypothetical protein
VRRAILRIGLIVGAVIALFGLAGFVGAPLLLRHVITGPVAAALNRPVGVGVIRVNPYTLKVDLTSCRSASVGRHSPSSISTIFVSGCRGPRCFGWR